MKGLIIIAHGSRQNSSNEDVKKLTLEVASQIDSHYSYIIPAFLELTTPHLTDACKDLIDRQCNSIDIFPYFLASGIHVKRDIPKLIQSVKSSHPDIRFRIIQPLGHLPGLSNFITNSITSDK